MATVYLLTGSPGTGKTTLIRQAIAKSKIKAGGFYTEELRINKIRQGFKLVALDGQEAILAHVDISSPHRVSKYGVDVEALEKVGVAAIHRAIKNAELIIIDEIGKMELYSPRFKEAVLQAIRSGKKVLGTVMLNPYPFADDIKRLPRVRVVEVTRDNQAQVLKDVTNWMRMGMYEDNP
ncbi:MAG: NTPase [Chloroflexi bacterium]|nr:NTPase [Chloroflexota bacterium]MBM3154145.1 NTPase [Chloroflexota bacterium]MBM3172227.1 NTPase [Chloroflexota bacterium]MBM3174726.1 NTPase [Chloroflexota bacterium]MBM4450345.1 NTPase [Chloroflexota bacterium]